MTNQNKNEKITYIQISKLYPHPDNPRKDLGDLSELADSIKAKGILQNLTVVPGHILTKEEWIAQAKAEGVSKANALGTYTAEYHPDGYTVIIGHRRMAASKLAGLTELPCVITEMSPQEQIVTMLLENMQRADLTVYEQAKGFQMMIDFGDTVESVAEKSGFSQSTVRRRIKLLDLDENKFKKSEARGATLFEYLELDKIKSTDLKNKVLDAIGTENFKYELKRAIDEENKKEYFDFVETELSKFAKKRKEASHACYIYKKTFGTWNKVDSIPIPDDAETAEYFYKRDNFDITLFVKKDEENVRENERENAERAEKEEQRQRMLQELEAATSRAFELRAEAIEAFPNTHIIKHLSAFVKFLYKVAFYDYCGFDSEDVLDILGMEECDDTDDERVAQQVEKEIEKRAKEKPGVMLLKAAQAIVRDRKNKGYFHSYYGRYEEDKELDCLYGLLCELGYEMSGEEKALQNGTSELFAK